MDRQENKVTLHSDPQHGDYRSTTRGLAGDPLPLPKPFDFDLAADRLI
ncbi:hypothetical protein [Kitasatospora sp. GP82]|nr:hypothetical protein [Kitasatospora sp. GP82]MDH6128698.1 hypothetical protein [Kitasatospora sp. GP82]